MTDVQQLLADFIQEHTAGGVADPLAFLTRATPADREQLGDLIDGYLSRAPRQVFDQERFAGSKAERLAQALEPVVFAPAGWSVLLPQLRAAAELKRSDLVARMASELGVADRTDKVAAYYHEMEQGRLDPDHVSDRVLDALAGLLGRTRDMLRAAGRAVAPPTSPAAAAAFARRTVAGELDAAASPAVSPEPEAWDEVDELFRGR